MPTPYVSGDSAIPNRWLNGSATVLWIGDSIGAAFENRIFQALRVNPAGICVRGSNYSALGAPAWAATGGGGLGAAGLLAETNYSPLSTTEALFNGSAVPVTGQPAALDARLQSNSGEPFFLGTRTGLAFAGVDWLVGQAGLKLRAIMYRNGTSSNGIARNSIRGSGSSSIAKGVGGFLNLRSTSPAYLADDIPFNAPAAAEDLYIETQSFAGATPTNGNNFVLCCARISTGQPGFTFVPASNGGWNVLTWLDTTKISDSALAGVLPLLGITDIVISIGQNNPASQTAALFQASLQQLVNRFRAALPDASIIFLPTHDTNNAGSAPHLAGFADAHYAVQQATANSCFLNLYKAGGIWTQNNALGFFTDGVHPSESGKMFFLQTLQGLLDQLIIGARTTAAGRYAAQSDLEDLFGQANIASWSQFDGSNIPDVNRIQRALDAADTAIDDFFRDSPYASPFVLGASTLTVTRWAATLAGVWLYRSRNAAAAGTPITASISVSSSVSLSASAGQPIDPYSALLADVRSEMSRCKSGVMRLDASPTAPTATNAPSIVT
jgi:lysophospholipase L1-like esterase